MNSLSILAPALNERYGKTLTYRQLNSAVQDGRLVGLIVRERGRWYWRARDLDAIAVKLELVEEPVAA